MIRGKEEIKQHVRRLVSRKRKALMRYDYMAASYYVAQIDILTWLVNEERERNSLEAHQHQKMIENIQRLKA